jgi:hypothetical protein
MDQNTYKYLANDLFTQGYVVFPVYTPTECVELLHEFQTTEKAFPEYKRGRIELGTKLNPYVLGGFGAYGNPASFHNLFVRKIRKKKIELIPIFGELLKIAEQKNVIPDAKSYKVAEFMDRMCKRIKGTSTTQESYHKDLIPKGRETDITIGGWVQISGDTSHLSCVPGTHTFFPSKSTKGFAQETGKTCTHEIPVPQGNIVLFFQNLGHCVHSITRKSDTYRVFTVYLLTTHTTHIYDYTSVIDNQGVPRLASDQLPWIYGPNHGSFWLIKLTVPWSKRVFKPEVIVTKTKADGTTYEVVESPMRSLKEHGFELYPPYENWERNLFIPSQQFILPDKTVELFLVGTGGKHKPRTKKK